MLSIHQVLAFTTTLQAQRPSLWLHCSVQMDSSTHYFGPILSQLTLIEALQQLEMEQFKGQRYIVLRFSRMYNIYSERCWYHRLNRILSFEITLDRLTNYISTFGGAYSQLGHEQWTKAMNTKSRRKREKLHRFAHGALTMASRLYKVAQLKDDDSLMLRCRLFAAQAWVQLGRLDSARRILRLSHPACQQSSSAALRGLYKTVRRKYYSSSQE
eukprot:TRINITY_DN6386_c0_g1_i1.p2 TRINITY_DN6386_c0_g1~~TRINITY_DN6386_c0_g1_i1.p2  ORF type:complete len:214 (+),score=20.31 TRINITY_DN6386_c0_g1_i1:1351-1992(+)